MDVVEWSRALDVRLSKWCCSVSMVWVQIPSREEQIFDSSKNLILTLFGLIFRRIYIYIKKSSVKKCTDKRCMTCPSLIEGTSFTFKNGRTFTVMQDISCKTKNLVYAIICSNCGEFYVGETKTELRTRMTVHRQQTRHQDLTIIRANEHFHDCSGGHFKIFPLYKVNTEGDFLRRRKETLLINILKPSLNDK